MKQFVLTILLTALLATWLQAGPRIVYSKPDNAFVVSGFKESCPATVDDIYKFARRMSIPGISYDESSRTWRVKASIWIGDGTIPGSAFFQLGSVKRPKETLIIAGDIWIRPAAKSIRRMDGRKAYINRLTAGLPEHSEIRPKILFDCKRNGQFGMFMGYRSLSTRGRIEKGGELFLYNTLVSAAVSDGRHNYRNCWRSLKKHDLKTGFYAEKIKFVNTTFSYFTGILINGIDKETDYQVDRCVFENGHIPFGDVMKAGNCVFRNLKAVSSGGEFTGCVFERNLWNWNFDGRKIGYDVILTNCVLGHSRRKNSWIKNRKTSPKWPMYPFIEERASVVFHVTGKNDLPVKQALVEVACEKHPGAAVCSSALTCESGKTPEALKEVVILVLKKKTATGIPGRPTIRFFNFTITVSASGYQTVKKTVSSEKLFRKLKNGSLPILKIELKEFK